MHTQAMGLLHYYYAEHESADALASIDGRLADTLMRLFGVQNAERSGVYSVRLVVAGVSGTLVKCEFSTVHTFLLFRPDDALVCVRAWRIARRAPTQCVRAPTRAV